MAASALFGLFPLLVVLVIAIVFIGMLSQMAGSDVAGDDRRNFIESVVGLSVVGIITAALVPTAVNKLTDASDDLDGTEGTLSISSGETHTIESETEEEYDGVDIEESGTLAIQSSGTLTLTDIDM